MNKQHVMPVSRSHYPLSSHYDWKSGELSADSSNISELSELPLADCRADREMQTGWRFRVWLGTGSPSSDDIGSWSLDVCVAFWPVLLSFVR